MAHEHEFYKGEKLFDYLHYRNCRFVRFVDNGKNSPQVSCVGRVWILHMESPHNGSLSVCPQ